MNDKTQQSAAQALVHEMGIGESHIEARRKMVGLEEADSERLASIRQLVADHLEEFASAFFDHLATMDEGRSLIASRALLERARRLKKEHLLAIVRGEYGMAYVCQRLELAIVYATAGLDTRAFLGAFRHLLGRIADAIAAQRAGAPAEALAVYASLEKVAFFDIALIIDVLVFERERTIRQQQEAIRELSTPVLQVRDRMLLLPIVGVIDTHRARMITEGLLRAIRMNRAKVAVMDVTGVATIDSKVANHILQTVTAARLMGTRVIVTGLSSEVAQSLAALGIELSKLTTVGDLQGGIEEAELLLGYRVEKASPAPFAAIEAD